MLVGSVFVELPGEKVKSVWMLMCVTGFDCCLNKLEKETPIEISSEFSKFASSGIRKFFSYFNSKYFFFTDPVWTRATIDCMVTITI